MQNAESYIAAALATPEATGASETPPPVSPEVPATVPDASATVADSDESDGEVSEAPVAPVIEEKKPVTKLEKSYEELARKEVSLRKEREAIVAEREQLTAARNLTEAAKKGDAMALLAAAGITWAKAARQVMEGHGAKDLPPEEQTAPPDELRTELNQLKARIAQKEEAESRARFIADLQAKVKEGGDKYKFTGARKSEAMAISFIEKYYKDTGRFPGDNLDETMEIALEAVEGHLAKEAESWRGVLTPSGTASNVPASSKSAVPAVGATSQQARTLTNSTGSGPQSVSGTAPRQLKSDEDYINAALAAAIAQ